LIGVQSFNTNIYLTPQLSGRRIVGAQTALFSDKPFSKNEKATPFMVKERLGSPQMVGKTASALLCQILFIK
jgi:hypothetical protein